MPIIDVGISSAKTTGEEKTVGYKIRMPRRTKKVSIVILNWNGHEYIKQCLESLKPNIPGYCEVIVVDNGSEDGSLDYLETLDWIKLIKNSENVGFTKGNNIAIATTTGTDILLLNNDTIIYQRDWLEKMRETAYSSDDVGVVGCRLVTEDGRLQHAGAFIRHPTYWGQQLGEMKQDINQYNIDAEVESVVFACVYIKREVIDKIGVQDEDYFAYFDDTDYCFRAREAGYKTMCCGGATIVHVQNVTTELNGVSFSEMYTRSQETFKRKWLSKMTSRFTGNISFRSICEFQTGYAVSCRAMMLALDRKNIDVRYKYVYGKDSPFPVEERQMSDNYIVNIIKDRGIDTSFPQVVYGQGDVFHKNDGRYKIGFTMLEVTGIPDEWRDGCNSMDEVWVPSTFNVKTFRESGVTKPIHVIPLGIDSAYFNPNIRALARSCKYTFLSVFQWGERKNGEKLIESFAREFRSNENVRLVIKLDSPSHDLPVIKDMLNLPDDSAEIEFIFNKSFPEGVMGAVYAVADCFVSATRGEGFGMPMLEAMACGLPVIATDWSAHRDFLTEESGYPVQVEKMIPAVALCPYYKGFEWAEVDEGHLRSLMRHVYENQGDAKDKGMAASEMVLSNWSWDRSADKIIERINSINRGGLE